MTTFVNVVSTQLNSTLQNIRIWMDYSLLLYVKYKVRAIPLTLGQLEIRKITSVTKNVRAMDTCFKGPKNVSLSTFSPP